VKPRAPRPPAPASPTRSKAAVREELVPQIRARARATLRAAHPHLTEEAFDRLAALHGPIDEPAAHAHMRAIRGAVVAALVHLGKVGPAPETMTEPDRQLLEVLRALDLFSFAPLAPRTDERKERVLGGRVTIPALDRAQRAVGFRAFDDPKLRDRRALIEQMLENAGVKLTTRDIALMSLAVGFLPDLDLPGASIEKAFSPVVDREEKNVRSAFRGITQGGKTHDRERLSAVVVPGTRGRPKKRS
jgi:hypothetical protein